VKEAMMEILLLVGALLVLDITAQLYGTDSRPVEAERRSS
jgi:hypothetical protein